MTDVSGIVILSFGDVKIDFGDGNILILQGADLADLSEDDFFFIQAS